MDSISWPHILAAAIAAVSLRWRFWIHGASREVGSMPQPGRCSGVPSFSLGYLSLFSPFLWRQARPEPWCVLYYYIRGPLYLPNRRGEERIAAAGGPGWTLFCSRALARGRRDGGRRKRGGSTTTRDEVGCIGLLGAAVGGAAAGGRLCKGPFFPGGTKRADCL